MANEKTPVVWDDTTNKHRPLGTGEKMGGLDASSLLSSDSGNLLEAGSDGLAYLSGSGVVDPRADNLLEESDRGKLQVTIDRIAEWLDGHPQDAAVLADAINVVSGDEGNVITAGSDKGAFLSKGAISAAVAGMTDAQKAQLADAIAARIASDIADGKTIVASGGKLTSDPTNATAAQKKAINQALADADSGLVVDNSTGKLKVDFSNMPTDKFEELLAGLKMQVPLAANLTLHVDDNSDGDSIVDGRGTAAKPFKTISGCITWAAGYYSLGRFSITVLVHPGTYDEGVTCPSYNASSGKFIVKAYDYANPPVIRRDDGARTNIHVTGGKWSLIRLSLVNHPVDQGGSRNWYPYCLIASDGASVDVSGCEFEMVYDGAASSRVRMFVVASETGSVISFSPMDTYPIKFKYDVGDASYLYVLSASTGGSMQFRGTFTESYELRVLCRGAATRFASSGGNGSTLTVSGSGDRRIYFTTESGQTCTGTKYYAASGGSIHAPTGGFPGTADSGYVESSTYSWYKEEGA